MTEGYYLVFCSLILILGLDTNGMGQSIATRWFVRGKVWIKPGNVCCNRRIRSKLVVCLMILMFVVFVDAVKASLHLRAFALNIEQLFGRRGSDFFESKGCF